MSGSSPHYSLILNQNERVSRSEGGAEEISIWDDPDVFVEAFNSSPDGIRQDHLKATRRRGGLRQVVAKAVGSRHGMTLSEYETQSRQSPPAREIAHAAHDAIRAVACLDPDHEANGRRFDKADVALGHALASASAERVASCPAYGSLVVELARKYRDAPLPSSAGRAMF
ncbi:hypothetical protein [Mesorhizobium sp. A556]